MGSGVAGMRPQELWRSRHLLVGDAVHPDWSSRRTLPWHRQRCCHQRQEAEVQDCRLVEGRNCLLYIAYCALASIIHVCFYRIRYSVPIFRFREFHNDTIRSLPIATRRASDTSVICWRRDWSWRRISISTFTLKSPGQVQAPRGAAGRVITRSSSCTCDRLEMLSTLLCNYQLQNASSMDLFYLNGVNVHVKKINSFENWNNNSMDQDFDFSFESIKKQFLCWPNVRPSRPWQW